MHPKEKQIYVGLDLHKFGHTAVLVDCWNAKLVDIEIENRPAAFPAFLAEVKKHTGDRTPIFGLEDVGGFGRSLAVFLLENGQTVKAVNSAMSHAQRMRHPTTQKSDAWDAFCVARVLANELDKLPDATPGTTTGPWPS